MKNLSFIDARIKILEGKVHAVPDLAILNALLFYDVCCFENKQNILEKVIMTPNRAIVFEMTKGNIAIGTDAFVCSFDTGYDTSGKACAREFAALVKEMRL